MRQSLKVKVKRVSIKGTCKSKQQRNRKREGVGDEDNIPSKDVINT